MEGKKERHIYIYIYIYRNEEVVRLLREGVMESFAGGGCTR
jgi:hypothetical protein